MNVIIISLHSQSFEATDLGLDALDITNKLYTCMIPMNHGVKRRKCYNRGNSCMPQFNVYIKDI